MGAGWLGASLEGLYLAGCRLSLFGAPNKRAAGTSDFSGPYWNPRACPPELELELELPSPPGAVKHLRAGSLSLCGCASYSIQIEVTEMHAEMDNR